MLRIKLSRVGKKKQPSYRLMVIERQRDPWGTSLENVGFYNPLTSPATITLKEERIKYWLSVGAQPTDTVHNILVEAKLITAADKKNVSKLGKAAKKTIADAVEAEKKARAEAKAQQAEAEKQGTENKATEQKK